MGYEVTWEPKGINKRFYEHVSSKDLIKAACSIHGDSRLVDTQYVVVDFTECTSHSVADPAMLEVLAIDEVTFLSCRVSQADGEGVKVAIIAADPVTVQLAEQFKGFSSHLSVRVFQTAADGRNWISILA
jgi:hypothetical protein